MKKVEKEKNVQAGDVICVRGSLEGGHYYPQPVHEVFNKYGVTYVKLTKYPDINDPPLLLDDIVTDEAEAKRIAIAKIDWDIAELQVRRRKITGGTTLSLVEKDLKTGTHD